MTGQMKREHKGQRKSRCKHIGVGVGVAMMLASSGVWADPAGPHALPLHVVSIKTDEADEQADALSAALRSEVRKAKGWSLGESDKSLEVLTLALRCSWPPDQACEAKIAEEIHADHFLWGTLNTAPKGQVAGVLHLWSKDGNHGNVPISYSANLTEPADESLLKIVRDALLALTGGAPRNSITVQAGSVRGEILLDGQPAGKIDGTVVLAASAGDHVVEIRAPGYRPAVGRIRVELGRPAVLTLAPELAGDRGGALSTRTLVGYSALGAGGLFLAGGLFSSLQVRSINNEETFVNYRNAISSGEDACDAADRGVLVPGAATPESVKQKCSAGNTYQALQWVFYGLGVVSAGTGVYLLTTEPNRESASAKASWSLTPVARKHGGGMDLTVQF